jgi:hypothetical protein
MVGPISITSKSPLPLSDLSEVKWQMQGSKTISNHAVSPDHTKDAIVTMIQHVVEMSQDI